MVRNISTDLNLLRLLGTFSICFKDKVISNTSDVLFTTSFANEPFKEHANMFQKYERWSQGGFAVVFHH